MNDDVSRDGHDSVQLVSGFTYRVTLLGGGECSFDLSRPREIWVCPPPAASPAMCTSRNDWMLVLDPIVVLRRGRSTAVQVFEEAGSTWTYTSAPARRIVYASESTPPVAVDWSS